MNPLLKSDRNPLPIGQEPPSPKFGPNPLAVADRAKVLGETPYLIGERMSQANQLTQALPRPPLDIARLLGALNDAVREDLITRDEARAWLAAASPQFRAVLQPHPNPFLRRGTAYNQDPYAA